MEGVEVARRQPSNGGAQLAQLAPHKRLPCCQELLAPLHHLWGALRALAQDPKRQRNQLVQSFAELMWALGEAYLVRPGIAGQHHNRCSGNMNVYCYNQPLHYANKGSRLGSR